MSDYEKDPMALRREIADLQKQLENKQRALDGKVRSCQHQFPETPTYDPIVSGGYEHRGDAPGTMGVDWRGPQWIPRQETPKWTRTCKLCGHTESTSQYDTSTTKIPKF